MDIITKLSKKSKRILFFLDKTQKLRYTYEKEEKRRLP